MLMILATLCFLIKGNEKERKLLLAMKKRGYGKGKWNGVGGKFDFEKGDKNIIDTAIRETKEEIGVEIKEFEKIAIITFLNPQEIENQKAHIFLAKDWKGDPKESEEMKPQWFFTDKIPFNEMWPDDKFWLPKILEGKKLKAEFVSKEKETISHYNIKILDKI